MKKWKEAELGDLLEISHGFAFRSRYFSEIPTANVLVTPGNFKIGGGFNDVKYKYFDGPYTAKLQLNPEDLIVNMTDISREGDTLGCVARVPDIPGKSFLHNQRIGRVTIKDERLDKDFLYWLMHTRVYRNHVLSSATGTTVKHTAPRRITSFRFPLPPLAKQKEIVSILTSSESKIDVLEQCNKNLLGMAMSVFKKWFIEYQYPGQEASVKGESPPPGWTSKPLSHFGKIICGQTPPKDTQKYFNGEIPFIKIPDMHRRIYITSAHDSLTDKGAATQPKKFIPPNSICISCIATVGLVAFNAIWAHTNQQINTLVPHDDHYRYYLYCRLKTMTEFLENLGCGGTSLLNISAGRLRQIPVIAPPPRLVKEFHKVVSPIFQRILLNVLEEDCLIRFIKMHLHPRGEFLRTLFPKP